MGWWDPRILENTEADDHSFGETYLIYIIA